MCTHKSKHGRIVEDVTGKKKEEPFGSESRLTGLTPKKQNFHHYFLLCKLLLPFLNIILNKVSIFIFYHKAMACEHYSFKIYLEPFIGDYLHLFVLQSFSNYNSSFVYIM